jgi:nitroreductase
MTPDQLLTTTRAVRKRLDLDRAVPLELVRECLEIAVQAPSGSNAQGWHFVVVTDAAKRRGLGELYRRAFDAYRNMPQSAHALGANADGERKRQMERVVASAEYLAENLARVPVHVLPCIEGRVDQLAPPIANPAQAGLFGSILPATWSFMLAARARGLGTSWTTLHLLHEREAAELLGIPYEKVTQAALVPLAYTKGTDFKPGGRKPLDQVLHVDHW